ncbi:MAG: cupin domain-containing protein [Bacteroidota bacterium]|nr:cupin domain-containing protein [Bacteroidota bacterium]
MNLQAEKYIELLDLQKHPEGGYFKEIYRSAEYYEAKLLPGRYSGDRTFSTSIYFLLEGTNVSRFHRLKSDETWHFYDGSTVIIYVLDQLGKLSQICLGKNLELGETLQVTIEKGCWFGAALKEDSSFCLIGCTVSPGFEFDDFELAKREFLVDNYPQYKEIITRLT